MGRGAHRAHGVGQKQLPERVGHRSCDIFIQFELK
jgi:hypothetical protein